MNEVNWVSKLVGLIGAVNTALIAFGVYHLSDDQLQALITVISAAVTIMGVWLPHLKGEDKGV